MVTSKNNLLVFCGISRDFLVFKGQLIISSTDTWAGARLNDLVATPDGGCIVAGASSYGGNPRLVKVSSAGTISWESGIEATIYSAFNSVCMTSDGSYIATGLNHNNMTGLNNLLVAKFSNTGAPLWSKTFYSGLSNVGDSIQAEGYSVVGTPDGGCLIAGYISIPGNYRPTSSLLMRLNSSGDSLWTRTYFPGTWSGGKSAAFKLLQLPPNQYLMFLHQNSGYTTAGAKLVKLNDFGDVLWYQVGYDPRIMMNGIDGDGGVLFSGYSTGSGPGYWDNVAVFIRTTSGGVFVSPQLFSPWNGQTDVNLRPNLIWYGTPHIISLFHVQVARDSNFTNIVFDTSIVATGAPMESLQVIQLLPNTKYFWRVQSFGTEGGPTNWSAVYNFITQQETSVEETDWELPTAFSLKQNYPNPFNSKTKIIFAIPTLQAVGTSASKPLVTLKVYDLLGREIATLVNETKEAGEYEVKFNADKYGLSSGVYLYQLCSNGFTQTKKFVYLR